MVALGSQVQDYAGNSTGRPVEICNRKKKKLKQINTWKPYIEVVCTHPCTFWYAPP